MAEPIKVNLLDAKKNPVFPSTSADQVKTADGGNVEAEIKALKALLASGVRPCGTVGAGGDVETLPASGYKRGDLYIVKTGGTYAGQVCEPGDLILCIKTFEEEAADTDWTVVQNNVVRAVKGPESAADGNLMAFDGTSGTVAKDSGINLAEVSAAVAQKHSHDNAVLLASISADGETVTINGKTFYAGIQAAVIEAGGEIPAGMSPTGIVFEKVADGPAA